MKDERWRNGKEWKMKDEGWRAVLQMNKLTDKQTYHQEDIDLRSFNYMVYGEPKFWFGCLPVVLIGFSILVVSNINISFHWLVLLEKLEKFVNSSQDSLAKWDHFVMKTVEIRNKVDPLSDGIQIWAVLNLENEATESCDLLENV